MLLRVSAGDTGDLGKVGKQLNELKQHCRWTVARDSETEAETLLWFVPQGKTNRSDGDKLPDESLTKYRSEMI